MPITTSFLRAAHENSRRGSSSCCSQTDVVSKAYSAASTALDRVEELREAAGRAVEALQAVGVAAEKVLARHDVPAMFWHAALNNADYVCAYIQKEGDGSSFAFDDAVELAAELERFVTVAVDETDSRGSKASTDA